MPSHYFSIYSSNTTVVELENVLIKISKLSLVSKADDDHLFNFTLGCVDITPPIVTLLIQILNQPLPKAPNGAVVKWNHVVFRKCSYTREGTNGSVADDDSCCSPDEVRLLGASLSRRTLFLELYRSTDILESLFDVPKLEIETMDISGIRLSAIEFERFGGWIQRNVCVKHLDLASIILEESQTLECLDNAIHLQELSITGEDDDDTLEQEPALSRQDGNDLVLLLLRNSKSCLKKLCLQYLRLEDRHLMAIMEALPMSNLEVLALDDNNIQRQGVLAFAAQLPKIKRLKRVSFGFNPWQDVREEYEECCTALLQGLRENYSIESLCGGERSTIASLLRINCTLNRAGRRILTSSTSVPVGLWPLLLERAGNDNYEVDNRWRMVELRIAKCRADSLFFFLKNSPILLSI